MQGLRIAVEDAFHEGLYYWTRKNCAGQMIPSRLHLVRQANGEGIYGT